VTVLRDRPERLDFPIAALVDSEEANETNLQEIFEQLEVCREHLLMKSLTNPSGLSGAAEMLHNYY
jgi:hypothetical protein